jgi:hypothetical protein
MMVTGMRAPRWAATMDALTPATTGGPIQATPHTTPVTAPSRSGTPAAILTMVDMDIHIATVRTRIVLHPIMVPVTAGPIRTIAVA